jgi:uncharacterized protein YkwD
MAGRTAPRLLALAALLASVAVVLPSQALSAGARSTSSKASLAALQIGVLGELNQIRRAHALPALRLNARLTAAAEQHTSEMLAKAYFAHESADGSIFWKRIKRYYGSQQFSYWTVGENLLWTSADLDPKRALKLWMASPEHRENILRASWREIGISALQRANAPGPFGGSLVTMITTDFGYRV